MNNKSANYPSQYESKITLRDGTRLRLRPIRLDDVEAWLRFVSRLGLQTKYLRFHNVPKEMTGEDAKRFCTVDYKDTFAIVAETFNQKPPEIVAIGRYSRLPRNHNAEYALVVEDTFQRKGLGTKMMENLVKVARDNDITTFEGYILTENAEMMKVLKDYGFKVTSKLEGDAYHVTFPVTERV
ncbi:MAG: GNAT family N-acetyltransferase [Chloroflexota bacterium]